MVDPTFSDSYRRLAPPLRSRCRRIVRDAAVAEDVVQEAFLRLWSVGPTVAEVGYAGVTSWLRTTSTHLSLDALRAGQRRGGSVEHVPVAGCVEGALDARAALEALRAHVPPRELEEGVLCRIDGHAHVEAAREMGVSERTVRRLLSRFDKRPRRGSPLLGLVLALVAILASRSCAAAETDVPSQIGAP